MFAGRSGVLPRTGGFGLKLCLLLPETGKKTVRGMREVKYARRKRGKLDGWWQLLVVDLILVCYVCSLEGLASAAAGIHRSLSANPLDRLKNIPRNKHHLPKYFTLSAHSGDALQDIERKNIDLRKELKKTPWPRLKYFWADGRSYSLPLRAESREPSHRRAKAKLEFLAGFFDGDGCVSCKLSGAYLTVSQSFDQAKVLMLFRDTFGGSIILERRGLGLRKPVLQWKTYGDSAREAALLLALRSITKQKQLLQAAQWPETKSARQQSKAKLHALKKYDSARAGLCSWEYCAGFFDAEGHIEQPSAGVSLRLRIGQKHPQVLKCLRGSLSRSLGINSALRKASASMHEVTISGTSQCKRMLQQMLGAGLVCKEKQAEIALGLTKQNAAQVSAQLACLTGNQMFGKKLDGAGQERARKIKNVQGQAVFLKRRGRLKEAEDKLRAIEGLKQQHRLLNTRRENQLLIEHIRKLHSLHDNSWHGPLAPGMR